MKTEDRGRLCIRRKKTGCATNIKIQQDYETNYADE